MSSEDFRNVIIAVVLSMGVFFLYQAFFVAPTLEQEQQRQTAAETEQQAPAQAQAPGAPEAAPPETSDPRTPQPPSQGAAEPAASAPEASGFGGFLSREEALAQSPRVPIRSDALFGSIALKGGVIDDLKLRRYRETVKESSPIITLLSPLNTRGGYAARFGWLPNKGQAGPLPDENTLWRQVGSGALSPENSITMQWDNGAGLLFERKISLDENYMFTVTERVVNSGDAAVSLIPYGAIERHDVTKEAGFGILHLGMIGALNGELKTKTYKGIKDEKGRLFQADTTGGWVGITDKYWLTALAPADQTDTFRGRFLSPRVGGRDIYQADYGLTGKTVGPGEDASVSTLFFAGAKKVRLINGYAEEYDIVKFENAVDWGWLPFFSRPFFAALDWIAKYVGNFGVAILIFTVLIKVAFFWFSQKSYVSMAKMKKVQPEMKKLQERHKDDKVKLQQEMMALYQKEKINPLAGCLPILIQFPVFIALYQVLFVTIEMRHAPFFGWIQDLSAPDPTSVFNLFGLLPYDPAQIPVIGDFLMLGVWPLIMGVSMWFQMKMNPPPPDPVQQRIFGLMPIVFTFILAGFAAGLVIYWAWNNILSIGQQYIIMKRMGVKPEWGNNIKLPAFVRKLTGGKETQGPEREGAVTQTARNPSSKDEG